jgi:hypothetical protein
VRGDAFGIAAVEIRLSRRDADTWARFFKIRQRLPTQEAAARRGSAGSELAPRLGDSRLPPAPGAGGSNRTASTRALPSNHLRR